MSGRLNYTEAVGKEESYCIVSGCAAVVVLSLKFPTMTTTFLKYVQFAIAGVK
jgi:hypothetical protein